MAHTICKKGAKIEDLYFVIRITFFVFDEI